MKAIFSSLLTIFTLITINGCTGPTLIKDLVLPVGITIEGIITQIDDNGFTLKDNSGSIYVTAKLPENKKLNIFLNEKVKVYGNLQGGQKKVFDGYVIEKSSGEKLIISNSILDSRLIFRDNLGEPAIMINPNLGIINPGSHK
jgi:hypothetical protein